MSIDHRFDRSSPRSQLAGQRKQVSDSVFFELTRSLCPECRRVIDAHILLRDGRVYMRKRCAEHGQFEALVYGDAEAYVGNARFNKPGEIPLEFATGVEHGCPHDCGLCPDHQQHACVGIIEVNSGCNVSFAVGDAGRLPLADAQVDFAICECALCLFPDKGSARSEFARVVGPGGGIGVADLTLEGSLPPELRTIGGWVACIADARPFDEYVEYFERCGFAVERAERHDEALLDLVRRVRLTLIGLEVAARLGEIDLPADDIERAKRLSKAALDAVKDGGLGYGLFVARRRP